MSFGTPPRRSWALLPLLVALVAGVLVVLSAPADSAVGARRKKEPPPLSSAIGAPRKNFVPAAGSYFGYPNRLADQQAIRGRVLATIQSTWGIARNPATGIPYPGGGTIRLATWSFEDMGIAKALVAAHRRGVSVQVVAAAGKNKHSDAWRLLRKKLGARLYPPGHPELVEGASFARICRGSCRGPGGTPHAKYYLFQNVGATGARNIVIQTSMNLTDFAYQNQWNQAQVWHSQLIYDDFLGIFNQARVPMAGGPWTGRFPSIGVADIFFPDRTATAATDPVMSILGPVGCIGATSGGNYLGHTRIRVIQYAIYGERGVWIAKRLRQLWNAGCDVKIIYSVASRPVLKILRAKKGWGPIPMRQSVITNSRGEITSYNHSKWMTITGRWGSYSGAWMTLSGSANWANLALSSDEQMQWVNGYNYTAPYVVNFEKTWRQRSSKKPGGSAHLVGGRLVDTGADRLLRDAPAGDPQFGKGVYRFLEED